MPRKQPFVNPQLVRDVEYIQRTSTDVLVDLGILMHILTKRNWRGGYQGWSDVPVHWLGSSSHMGYTRVKAALDRLAEWGIIAPMSTNGKKGPFALRYRYDLRREALQLAPEETPASAYEEEELVNPYEAPPKPARVRRTRPPIKSGPQGAYGEVYVFDNRTWLMRATPETPTVYASSPICQTCGRVYHNTMGAGKVDGQCAGCLVQEVIAKAIEEGEETHTIRGPYGEKTFTKEEMVKLVEKKA